jgi:orotidine-5'-phosphate decarboxylase
MMSPSGPRIIVALDFAEPAAAEAMVDRLDPASCRLKVGNELFTRAGPERILRWQERGFAVFLDLKYHDIPNTVASACRAAADLGVWMVNVHALGGRRMLEAARSALDEAQAPPLLVAVTVLTSLEASDLAEVGLGQAPEQLVGRLAGLAADTGCDGVVCSAREAASLRASHGAGFVLVTPGIRAPGEAVGDQRRTVGPGEAIAAGATYLVVGRPVTAAADPGAALAALAADVEAGL